jgi:aminoglycoside phosphotransferase (APT) family kinase protein
MRALTGRQFTEVMCQIKPESQLDPFVRVGKILAELHHADLHPTSVWTPAKELKTLRGAMEEVKLACPHLTQTIDRAIAQLTEMAQTINFPNHYPIHANLFGDQILYDGDRIGIVDWDTLSFGDPHYDIGRFLAHFIYLAGRDKRSAKGVRVASEALLQGYEANIEWKLDRTCLTWHVVAQILLRGKISSLRKLPNDWQAHLEFVVAETEWLLAGCSEYVFLPSLAEPAIALGHLER